MGVGHQTDFDLSAFGPFGSLVQSYLSAFESLGTVPTDGNTVVSTRMRAPLKAAARCQLEFLGLANRRTQAYLQIPARLAQCRSPHDVLNEQMAFWRTAAEQYGDSFSKVFETWVSGDVWGVPGGQSSVAERDYINFNGTGSKESAPARSEPPAGRQRRVA